MKKKKNKILNIDHKQNKPIIIAVFCLIIFLLFGIVVFKKLRTPQKLNSLVGVWQDLPLMAAGWSNRYHFYPDGTYSYVTSQMNCAKRERQIDGTWKIKENTLTLQEKFMWYEADGEVVDDAICGKKIIGSHDEDIDLHQSPLTYTVTFSTGNPAGKEYPRQKATINGMDFWRFYEDPNMESPVVLSHTKRTVTLLKGFSFDVSLPPWFQLVKKRNGDFLWYIGGGNGPDLMEFADQSTGGEDKLVGQTVIDGVPFHITYRNEVGCNADLFPVLQKYKPETLYFYIQLARCDVHEDGTPTEMEKNMVGILHDIKFNPALKDVLLGKTPAPRLEE